MKRCLSLGLPAQEIKTSEAAFKYRTSACQGPSARCSSMATEACTDAPVDVDTRLQNKAIIKK